MRILIVTPMLPYPPTWGFVTRVYQFVRLLATRHSVTLLSFATDDDRAHIDALRDICTAVHTVPPPVAKDAKRVAQLASMFSTVSYQWRSHQSEQMQRTLDTLSREQAFDVIQIESSQLGCLRYDPRAALVVDEHNIEYELLYRTYLTERSLVRRVYNFVEYKKFRREETSMWRQATGVVTTSVREAEMIRDLVPEHPVTCVPNAVDVDYFTPSAQPIDPNALVFTGLMKYRPNVDAAVYFVREVLPQLLAVRPTLVFYIVGGGPPEEVLRLAGPNVVVTGTVPDVRPYVHKAAVFVVPLRMGGGTRLKVLEGLSMRKAMVSTSLGCEGIDVKDGEHLLIADSEQALANAVLRVLDDAALADRLATAGRELVDRQYRWDRVVRDLEAFYEALLGRPRAATP